MGLGHAVRKHMLERQAARSKGEQVVKILRKDCSKERYKKTVVKSGAQAHAREASRKEQGRAGSKDSTKRQ